MSPVAVTADLGKAEARAVLVVVRARAAARPGMKKAVLVVETPVAVLVQMEQYQLEEALAVPCVRQRPEAQVYLAQEALAVPCVRGHFGTVMFPPGETAALPFAPLEVPLLLLKLQEVLASHLNCLEQRDLAQH